MADQMTWNSNYMGIIALGILIVLVVSVVVGLYTNPSFSVTSATVIPANVTSSAQPYLVVLSSEHEANPKSIREAEAFLNLSPDCRYKSALHGFSCRMTEAQVARIREHPTVATIEPDIIVNTLQYGQAKVFSSLPVTSGEDGVRNMTTKGPVVSLAQFVPWGVTRSGACSNALNLCNGSGTFPTNVDVYVVDTGIDLAHPELNVVSNRTFVTSRSERNLGGRDLNGHGTHVAGIIGARDNGTGIVGVAPGVRLNAIKVLDARGSGFLSWIVSGLDYIAQIKTQNPTKRMVVNLSLGATTSATTSMDLAVRRLITKGVTVCVAAGNERTSAANSSPAHVVDAITVGSFASNNRFSTFSNFGSLVDILAPGTSILSTYPRNRYATLSGTSMACPHVAGACALYLTNNNATPAQVRSYLLSNAANQANVPITSVPASTTTVAVYVA